MTFVEKLTISNKACILLEAGDIEERRLCGNAEKSVSKVRTYLLILLMPFSFINCVIDNGNIVSNTTNSNTAKIYSGSYKYEVTYRIER